MKDIITKVEDGKLLLSLNREIYEREAILVSTYKFTDKCIVLIEPVDQDFINVYFKLKNEDDKINLMKIAEAYCNEILDQQLRLDIERKYGNIRELIVEQAFRPIANFKDKIQYP